MSCNTGRTSRVLKWGCAQAILCLLSATPCFGGFILSVVDSGPNLISVKIDVDSDTATNTLNAVNIALIISGPTGSVTLSGSASVPSTLPAFPAFRQVIFTDPPSSANGPIKGVSVENFGLQDVTLNANQSYHLVTLGLTPTANASGPFTVHGVGALSSYSVSSGTELKFANLPDDENFVPLGTFNVTAVPEPSSVALVATCFTVAALRLRMLRSRERQKLLA